MRVEKSDMVATAAQAGRDVAAAVGLLTRLPVPVDAARAQARGAGAAWAWPLAGVAVALICGALGAGMLGLGLPAPLVAGLVLGTGIVVTGGLHEDGLADSADGLWGGWTVARRLEIMRDSHIGTFGVLALALSVLLRWQALALLLAGGALWGPLVAAAVLSRAPMAALMVALPPARADGLSRSVGVPTTGVALGGAALALAVALVAVGPPALALALGVAAVAAGCGALARARIGGQTGDILGATQQVCEVAVLLALAAIL